MNAADQSRIEAFIKRWIGSSGNERANCQPFLLDLCDALGVERPNAKGSIAGDPYCFEKDVKFFSPNGTVTSKFIDLYKADHFILEAKQGGTTSGKGTAKRGTLTYQKAMEAAFVQAIAYARNVSSKPPFVITCDIGDRFELWTGFSGDYGGYGARQEILLADLVKEDVFDLFVDIFTDPQKRNPEKIAAKVTREVAADLAELAKSLECPHPQPLSRRERGADPTLVPLLPREKGLGDEGISQIAGINRKIPPVLLERAKELRVQQTPAEQILWECLRDRRLLGAKFRRQHNIGQFIADFYCHAARLVVELDGEIHEGQALRDAARDEWMQSQGLRILRFSNREILANLEKVLDAIAVVVVPSPPTPLPQERGADPTLVPLLPREKGLGDEGNSPQAVAQFLMRCIFTMFAEDVELLKEHLFTQALETRWISNPKTFKPEVERLWQAMNKGEPFGFSDKLLQFNGGLFAEATAFDLTPDQLQVLLKAAKRDWRNVEPAIFGTLLERALDAKERSKLGAHYTPRSYVERLVRPVVMEPLREQWETVQAEVKRLLNNGDAEPTEKQKKDAVKELEAFLKELRETKILDPACGSGNFLYVTLDLLKQLESEVFQRLADVTGVNQLRLDEYQVNPSQFLGIEINPRAAAIADLVIWIGYLQWHFRRFGDIPPIEPVLREYQNIECRDAVLAYDGKEPDIDEATGKVRTRWGGRMMKSPVTGEEIPDPSDRVIIYRYLNPRAAEWQEADYIVSNPPFLGNARMREVLGDGYTETLRKVYEDVPDTVDFVMYWWHKAAELVQATKINRFGFITTNSIRQVRQRKVIEFHQNSQTPINLIFAIPDHPWAEDGAAVRIAMTAAEVKDIKSMLQAPRLGIVLKEKQADLPEDSAETISIEWHNAGKIFSNLQTGADLSKATALLSNQKLSCPGMKLHGQGFCLTKKQAENLESEVIYRYLNGRDLLYISRNLFIIDFFGYSEQEISDTYPKAYQWIYERVKPERDQNNREVYRRSWWSFGEPRANFRPVLKGLSRYIATVETAKHRIFVFLEHDVVPDNMLTAIALNDAYFLGVLSSRIHVTWALAAGGDLGGNTPRYNKTVCFDPFPFPDPTDTQKQTIRDLGERLDAHRKRVQAQHPEVTITAMYNLLEKLRKGEPFTDADKAFNQKALITTLKQIHDDLDKAVFEAYGWDDLIVPSPPTPLPQERGVNSSSLVPLLPWEKGLGDEGLSVDEVILDRLVTLNAQRAEEERNGFVRWLRPDYQAPQETQVQQTLEGIIAPDEPIPVVPIEQLPFPKSFKDQLSAIRDLLRTHGGEWTATQIIAQFKNATRQKRAILESLESLEDLGILASHEDNHIRYWYLADLLKAS